jgi:hypothetical protein
MIFFTLVSAPVRLASRMTSRHTTTRLPSYPNQERGSVFLPQRRYAAASTALEPLRTRRMTQHAAVHTSFRPRRHSSQGLMNHPTRALPWAEILLPGWLSQACRNYHHRDGGHHGPMVLTIPGRPRFSRSAWSMFKCEYAKLDPAPSLAFIDEVWQNKLLRQIYKKKEEDEQAVFCRVNFVLIPSIAQAIRRNQRKDDNNKLSEKPLKPPAPRNAWSLFKDDCKDLDPTPRPGDVAELWQYPTLRRLYEKKAQDEESAYTAK